MGILANLTGPDDYALAATRPQRSPARQHVVTAVMTVAALVVGFISAVGFTTGRGEAAAMDGRKTELVALITERSAHADDLAVELEALRAQVAEAEGAAGAPHLPARIEAAEVAAGLVAVQGPGVVIAVDDAGSSCRSTRTEDCRIQDRDLQLIANELFAAGAEAVSINGERLVATSAIRRAGGAVLVNYRVLSPPYEVVAIGHRDHLPARLAGSAIAADFAGWRDLYGLHFELAVHDEVVIPAYAGSLSGLTARPLQPVVDSPVDADLRRQRGDIE